MEIKKASETVLEGLLELGFIFDLNDDEREMLLENIAKSLKLELMSFFDDIQRDVDDSEEKQKHNTTQNICGHCFDDGVIEGKKQIARILCKSIEEVE